MSNKPFKDTVAETLLIPLYMRAKESRRKGSRIIEDKDAERLVNDIEYDYSKFDNAKLSAVGCAVRCWYLDNVVREFVKSHVNPVVVNVACGLDARFQRTTSTLSDGYFYSLDLPEVITLRAKLLPETKREKYISASLFDTAWMEQLKLKHPNSSFLFVMEGVLMYFTEKEVKGLFTNIANRFTGSEVWFDACGTFVVKNSDKHDAIKKVNAKFKWGINNGRDIEKWDNCLSLIKQSSQGLFFRSRYPFPMNLIGMFPNLLYKFCSIIGIRIN
jgi:O-Methyltransferase involved in polyketide biosynthesis